MGDVFFSVVVPCYNVENNIIPTLTSLTNQTFKDFEIILVNDGSKDGTLNILKSYPAKVKKVVVDQQNKGLGGARNSGVKASSGKYIALLDGDDIWEPEKLSVIYNYLKGKDIDLICHNEFMVDARNKLLRKNYYGPYVEYEDILFKGNCLSPSAVTVKKEVFDRVGLFNEDRKMFGLDDYDMWLRMAFARIQFVYVNDFLGNYVIHGTNMSRAFSFFKIEEKIILLYSLKVEMTTSIMWKLRKRLLIFYLIKLKGAISTNYYSYLPVFFKDTMDLFFATDFISQRLKKLDA